MKNKLIILFCILLTVSLLVACGENTEISNKDTIKSEERVIHACLDYNDNSLEFEIAIIYDYKIGSSDDSKLTKAIGVLYDGNKAISQINLLKGTGYNNMVVSREQYAKSSASFLSKYNDLDTNPDKVNTIEYYKGTIEVEDGELKDSHIELTIVDKFGKSKYNLNKQGITNIIDK